MFTRFALLVEKKLLKLIYNCPPVPKPVNLISNHWNPFFNIQKILWFGSHPTPTLLGLSLCAYQPALTSATMWAMDSRCETSTQGWDPSGGLTCPGGRLMLTFAFRDENLFYERWPCFLPQPTPHHETVLFTGSIHATEWAAGRIYFPIISSRWSTGYLHVLIDTGYVNPWFVNGKKDSENC